MYSLSRNKRLVNKINEACKEGLIIILDATGTSLGDVINLYAHGNLQNRSNNKVISLSLHKAINKAVDMMGNILQPRTPTLFLTQTSGDIDSSWRISAITVGVPYIVVGEDAFEVDI